MVETSTDYYYTSPMIIKPILDTSSSISSYLVDDSNNYVIMTLPAAINISDEHTNNLDISAIVTTSDNAIIKADGNGSVVKEDGDIEGPFNLCVVAQENLSLDDGTITSTKLIVIGNSDFIDTSSSSLVTTGNYKLTTIICDYLQDSVEKLYISSKSLEEATIETSQTDFIFYGLLYTVAIPFVVIIIGVVIWVRRKHL
jgi:uncharacterized membrane protein